MSKYPGRVLSATPPAVSVTGASGIWTQEEVAQYNAEGVWPVQPLPYDPYFQNTVLLLHGDGNQGATNFSNISDPVYLAFKDNSSNNFPITVNGDAYGDNFGPYALEDGNWSNYFDGSGDYLSLANNAAFALWSGDFTIEAWIYRAAGGAEQYLFSLRDTGGYEWRINATNLMQFFFTGGSSITSSGSIPINAWTHIAVSRETNTVRFFINGSLDSSATFSNGGSATASLYIGYGTTGGGYFSGYMSNARIVKGTAVYTSAFTPSTTPLTAISNTSLLTCQSNRFVDNSTNNFALTPAGNVAVKVFNPFGELPDGVNGSGFFDGSGDYLTTPTDAAFAVGSAFTIEFWVNPFFLQNYSVFIYLGENSGDLQFGLNLGNLGVAASGVAWRLVGTAGPALNEWSHCVLVRSGTGTNQTSIFLNGIRVANGTVTDAWTTNRPAQITTATSTLQVGGFFSNVRIVKGSAVYDPANTTITVPASPLTAVSGTELLTCQYAGTVRNVGFIDSGPYDFTITRYGNTTQGTFSPFSKPDGRWGNYFNGTTAIQDGILSVPDNAALVLTSTAFTIEAWVYMIYNTTSYTNWIVGKRSTSGGTGYAFSYVLGINPSNYPHFFNGTFDVISSTAISLNTWNHVCVTHDGTNATLYLNGSIVAGPTSATIADTSASVTIGNYSVDTPEFNGYISGVKIVKGYANAPSGVPTTPATNTTGTSLLTCQSNRFVDNSSNAFAITAAGNVAVTPFSPFPLDTITGPYSPSVNGGAAYFDGSGDYLAFPSNSAFAFGTGDFTIEAWVYPLSRAAVLNICGTRGPAGTVNGWNWGILTNGSVQMYSNGAIANTGADTVPLNAWTLITFTRSSGTITGYINGVSKNTAANTQDFTIQDFWVGITGGSAEPFNGYISSLRLLKGTATTPSVPTSPFTAVANTSLLLNFTNAGIYDNTCSNALETVGNAQVDTTTKKYGTGSIEFDGTGDYIVMPFNKDMDFTSSGSITVEFWMYGRNTTRAFLIGSNAFNNSTSNYSAGIFVDWTPSVSCYIAAGMSGSYLNLGSGVTANAWHHLAFVYDGSTTTNYAFLNGSLIASSVSSSAMTQTGSLLLGVQGSDRILPYDGFIDDLRISRIARYTTTFDPPTLAFRNIGA